MSKQITQTDISLYAAVTGDFNPLHFDPVYAEKTPFKGRVAHGLISAGLFSTLLALKLPGPGTIYLHQTIDFTAPVRIGDVITATVEAAEFLEKNRVRLITTCTNQDGVKVIGGEALVIAPK